MAENTKIEWTDATWNPWHGCRKVSQGCKNCYMFRDKDRYGQDPTTVLRSKTTFYDPLKWSEPQKVFTCSWSDFFIEEADEWRDEAFAIMALTPHLTYQVLTKRPERMLEYLSDVRIKQNLYDAIHYGDNDQLERRSHELYTNIEYRKNWPLPNVHLGVSVEDQKTADERIPKLLDTPAAVRFLSMEPLLGEIDLLRYLSKEIPCYCGNITCDHDSVDWVIVGTESGNKRRPMKLEWAENIVEQCKYAGVPVFVKQIELNGRVEKDIDKFPSHLQVREFPEVSNEQT